MRVHQPPTGPEPDGPDRQALLRLLEQVDRLDRQAEDFARVRAEVDTHTRTLADLTDLLRRLTDGQPATGSETRQDEVEPPVMEWLTLTDPEVAVRFLTDLTVWVRDVFSAYVPAGAQFAECWAWHPVVVAELLACQAAWIAAVHPKAPLEALAGWHDRWRPGTWQRVYKLLARCERDVDALHVIGSARYRYDLAYLDEYAEWWAAGRHPFAPADTAGAVAPGLTLYLVPAGARSAPRQTTGGRP